MQNISPRRDSTIRSRVSEVEWQTRVDLAAFYRLVALYGMSEIIYNHVTARVPGTDDEFLINPYGLMYEEITASSLIKINVEGKVLLQGGHEYGVNAGGYVIHSAVHAARHDIACIAHTHTEAGMAVAAMKCGLLPLTQNAMLILDNVGYHDFEGPAVDTGERVRLVADLGDKFLLILRNHGLLACGRNIPDAFRNLYYLETACRAQTRAMAAGTELNLPSDAVRHRTAVSLARSSGQKKRLEETHEGLAWLALRRKLDRMDPGYAT